MEKGKSTTFTVELDGISLPEAAQKEISAAINQLVIAKLGSLDLNTSKAVGSSLIFKGLINGGRLLNINAEAIKNLQTNIGDHAPAVGNIVILGH